MLLWSALARLGADSQRNEAQSFNLTGRLTFRLQLSPERTKSLWRKRRNPNPCSLDYKLTTWPSARTTIRFSMSKSIVSGMK